MTEKHQELCSVDYGPKSWSPTLSKKYRLWKFTSVNLPFTYKDVHLCIFLLSCFFGRYYCLLYFLYAVWCSILWTILIFQSGIVISNSEAIVIKTLWLFLPIIQKLWFIVRYILEAMGWRMKSEIREENITGLGLGSLLRYRICC